VNIINLAATYRKKSKDYSIIWTYVWIYKIILIKKNC